MRHEERLDGQEKLMASMEKNLASVAASLASLDRKVLILGLLLIAGSGQAAELLKSLIT